MNIIPITHANSQIFDVLVQDYESEFSGVTKKEPNADGRYALDSDWREPNSGFYALVDEKPAGFVIKGISDGRSDIAEFYIVPGFRKQGLGKKFAFTIFDMFPGPWQVRQIPTAEKAIAFWRTTIREYTHGNYTEDLAVDSHWGEVVRQQFHSRVQAPITIHALRGEELLSNIPELKTLRTTIFREYPYLYESDPALEKAYLSLFVKSSDALFIVAKMGSQVVGAISGLPLNDVQQEIKDAFNQSDIDTSESYALCEIILLNEYRNKKIASRLYKEFEDQLHKMPRFKKIVLWQIVRNENDPKRPADYFSPNNFWRKLGFTKHPKLACSLSWKEISDEKETSHLFEFWIKY